MCRKSGRANQDDPSPLERGFVADFLGGKLEVFQRPARSIQEAFADARQADAARGAR